MALDKSKNFCVLLKDRFLFVAFFPTIPVELAETDIHKIDPRRSKCPSRFNESALPKSSEEIVKDSVFVVVCDGSKP
jgi:hypothetical protein